MAECKSSRFGFTLCADGFQQRAYCRGIVPSNDKYLPMCIIEAHGPFQTEIVIHDNGAPRMCDVRLGEKDGVE
jgi:hypothetical protein